MVSSISEVERILCNGKVENGLSETRMSVKSE